MKINLSEIFVSIQGEGPNTGQQVVFVRFSGCNLRCQWGKNRCDTPYTSWEPETNLVEAEDILHEMRALNSGCKHVVITGGEPTLQEAGLSELCRFLKPLGYKIDLETNGTRLIPNEIDTVVCSPKLSDSAPLGFPMAVQHQTERQLFKQHIKGNDPRVYLKFVVGANTNIQEIMEIVELLECPKNRVYLMPQGTDSDELSASSPAVAELALLYGFNFSPRLQIMLWGNLRGK